MKQCTKCNIKNASCWYRGPICNKCYYIENKNSVLQYKKQHYNDNKKTILARSKKRYEKHKNKILINKKNYYIKNRETMLLYKRQHYINNKDKIVKHNLNYIIKRSKSDIMYKLSRNLRSRLHSALKNNHKSGSAIRDLGCSIEELKQHLKSKFQPGMTWSNYGLHGWHIDHIQPLSSFNLGNIKEFKKACHHNNLQPMWAKDNLSKGTRYEI